MSAEAPTAGRREGLLVVAGEASGDLYGARLLASLRGLRPQLDAFGLGSDELRRAGLDTVADSREIAVVGVTEALRILPRARRIFYRLLSEVEQRQATVALLIDSPDFNLRLARKLKQRGCRVIYYVSPQVWAWRRGRLRSIARRVDKMLVLFAFEVDLYRQWGVDVAHVGHPLVDEIPQLPQIWDRMPQPERFRVALLPGSRESEVRALVPELAAAARLLSSRLPVSLQVIQAPSISRDLLLELWHSSDSGGEVKFEIVGGKERHRAVADSHLALCASGTATLEVGLLGTPMIVVYKVGRWTFRIARRLVRVTDASLVNLVLGKSLVSELLQDDANGERIAAEAYDLLTDPGRVAALRNELAELRPRLGSHGASERAAMEVERFLAAGEESRC